MLRRTRILLGSCTVVILAALFVGGNGCSPAARKERHLARADSYFSEGRYDHSEIEYLNVLQLEPRNSHAVGRLGIIYFEQGRIGRCAPFLLAGLETDPSNVELRIRRGMIHLALAEFDDARRDALDVLALDSANPQAARLLAEAVDSPESSAQAAAVLSAVPIELQAGAGVLVAHGILQFQAGNFAAAESYFTKAATSDPNSSAAFAALGAMHLRAGRIADAKTVLQKASKLSPARSPHRLAYADFMLQTGDVIGAVQILQELTKQTPDYLPAWIALTKLSLIENRPDDAASHLAKVLSRDPASPEALILNSQILIASGRVEEAVNAAEKASAMYPAFAHAHLQLGRTYIVAGQTEKGIASLARAIQLQPRLHEATILLAQTELGRGESVRAIEALRRLIADQPHHVPAKLLLADALLAGSRWQEAALVARDLEGTPGTEKEGLVVSGRLHTAEERWDEARQSIMAALRLDPGYYPALTQLANIAFATGDFDEARDLLDRFVSTGKPGAEAYALLARVSAAAGEAVAARKALERGIAAHPSDVELRVALARHHYGAREWDDSLEHLRLALNHEPGRVEALMYVGLIQEQRRQVNEALKTYEALLVLHPAFGPALNNLACLYSDHFNELERAQELAGKARVALPDDPNVADTLGWILYRRGQYARAATLLREAVQKLPDNADYQFHLGMACYRLAHEADAEEALRRSVQLAPGTPHAEAQSRLAILMLEPSSTVLEDLISHPDVKSGADAIALSKLAQACEERGDVFAAVEFFEAAAQAPHPHPRSHAALGRLYLQLGMIEKAFEAAKAARRASPNDPAVAYLLGRTAHEVGLHAWAVDLLRECARQQPKNTEVISFLRKAEESLTRTTPSAGATPVTASQVTVTAASTE